MTTAIISVIYIIIISIYIYKCSKLRFKVERLENRNEFLKNTKEVTITSLYNEEELNNNKLVVIKSNVYFHSEEEVQEFRKKLKEHKLLKDKEILIISGEINDIIFINKNKSLF